MSLLVLTASIKGIIILCNIANLQPKKQNLPLFIKLKLMDKQLEMFPAIKPKAKLMAKNSFTKALQMLDNPMSYMQMNEVANPATFKRSIHQGLITHDYHTLSQLYVGSGLIATAIENPINDAFSKGFEIKSEHLGSDDIKQITDLIEQKELYRQNKRGYGMAEPVRGRGAYSSP
jgi:hypothetical protein